MEYLLDGLQMILAVVTHRLRSTDWDETAAHHGM